MYKNQLKCKKTIELLKIFETIIKIKGNFNTNFNIYAYFFKRLNIHHFKTISG